MVFFDDKAATINDLIEAIEAVELELGLTPSGVYASVRTRLDILEARINNPFAPAPNVENPFFIGNDGVTISTGFGYPTEDRIPGSLYLREDGYNDEGLYARRPDGYWHQIDTDPWTAKRDLAGTIYSQTVVGLQDHDINPDASLLQTDTAGDGYVLTWNATANLGIGWWEPQIGFFAFGDLSGTKINQTVINLQGKKLVIGTPTDGYAIIWNGVTSQFEPQRLAVVFDPLDNGTATVIRSNRYTTQSPVDNTKTGIVNLSSDSTQTTLGATGDYAAILGGDQNQADGDYSVISGGFINTNSGITSFIGGGNGNIISVGGNTSVIVGGIGNTVGGTNSSIVGGNTNIITDDSGFIGGGDNHQITATDGFNAIVVGSNNSITNGGYSGILAGFNNTISALESVIGAGDHNTISDGYSFIGSGDHNTTSGSGFNFIGSGEFNTVNGSTSGILSGYGNLLQNNFSAILSGFTNTSSGTYSLIGTGAGNNITISGVSNNTILNGVTNTINGSAKFDSILNGTLNTITGNHSLISGGSSNTISDGYSVIHGLSNAANSGSTYATIFGNSNTVGSSTHVGIWGTSNTVDGTGNYSFIFGDGNSVAAGADHSRVFGQNNTVGAASPFSLVAGSLNTITGGFTNTFTVGTLNTNGANFGIAFGQQHSITRDHTFVHGKVGKAINFGQYTHAANTGAGVSQFSRMLLNGTGLSGAAITLTTDGTNNIVTQDGYCYDMEVRILVNDLQAPFGTCARYVFDVLAHTESGSLVIDRVNATLLNDNGTVWVVNNWLSIFTTSGNQLVVTIPSSGVHDRRATASVEWRELTRS